MPDLEGADVRGHSAGNAKSLLEIPRVERAYNLTDHSLTPENNRRFYYQLKRGDSARNSEKLYEKVNLFRTVPVVERR